MASRRQPPSYLYDTRTARFRDATTGRLISRQFVQDKINERITEGLDRLEKMLVAVQSDQTTLTLADWQTEMARTLRILHGQMAVMGKGGINNMTQADWGRMGATLKKEYGFLQNFAQQIANGDVSAAQVRPRMNQYANKIWNSYWTANTAAHDEAGATLEQRILHPAEHCQDCIDLADGEWHDLGSLPDPGDGSTQCGSNDKCTKIYARREGNRIVRVGGIG